MAGRHTRLAKRGDEIALSHTTTDAPFLPVEQMEKLKELDPSRIDWVFEQTQIESEFRRSEERRVNTFVFIERMVGLLLALCIGLSGLGAAYLTALGGHDMTASIIGGTTLVGLVSTFIAGKSAKSDRNK
jgi:hypothetical protein